MRKEPTDAEKALWRLLRAKRFSGFKFRRQVPLGRYIADFVCLEKRLIVEADGGQHSESAHDAARDAWLASQGFHVLRFWNHEVLREARMVEDTIWRDLHRNESVEQGGRVQRDPSPSPAELLSISVTADIGAGEVAPGCEDRQAAAMPVRETDAANRGLSPKPLSPLAGESKREGSHGTSSPSTSSPSISPRRPAP